MQTLRRLFSCALLLTLAVLLAPLSALHAPAQAQTQTDTTEPLPAWDGQSRFTVLILGSDRRPNARDTFSTRTDVMILVSVDPSEQRIGVMHLPRDLHMVPPGSDVFRRINTLMIVGEDLQPGYGPYYAMDTIQYNLSLYIDRYVMFDFESFIAIIDAIGGIEITTTYDIYDDEYPDMDYGFEPFFLPAGTHQMDGRTALKFARTRHQDTDVMRGIRQMQVISAVHQKVRQGNTLARLIRQAPQLMRELDRLVYTDMTLQDMVQLAWYAAQLPPENIHTGSVNRSYQLLYSIPQGGPVYIPDHAKMGELMTDIFGPYYYR
jgi:polyisoprenyl-teichoic acid--peptidoglycan teichoic acid transferase